MIEPGGDELAVAATVFAPDTELPVEMADSHERLTEMRCEASREVREGARCDADQQFEVFAAVEGVRIGLGAGGNRYRSGGGVDRNRFDRSAAAARAGQPREVRRQPIETSIIART